MSEMDGSMGESRGMGMMGGSGVWFINVKAAEGHMLEPMLPHPRLYPPRALEKDRHACP